MVRAAASGALNYSEADPDDKNWHLRKRLTIKEIVRQEEERFARAMHAHWLGYIAHGNLTQESFENVRERGNEALLDYQTVLFPWRDAEPKQPKQTVTIDEKTNALIEAYKKQFQAGKAGK